MLIMSSLIDFSTRYSKYKQLRVSSKNVRSKRNNIAISIRKDERERLYAAKRQGGSFFLPECEKPSDQDVANEIAELMSAISADAQAALNNGILHKLQTLRNQMLQWKDIITSALRSNVVNLLKMCIELSNELIYSEVVYCIAAIADGVEDEVQEMLQFIPFLVSRLQQRDLTVLKEAAIVLGSISMEFPQQILESDALKFISEIIQSYLDSECNEESIGMIRVLVWLLCNAFRSCLTNFPNIEVTILLRNLLEKLINKGGTGRCVFMQHNTYTVGSVAELPIHDDHRATAGESIWCLTYLMNDPQMECVRILCNNQFLAAIVKLIEDAVTAAQNEVEGARYEFPSSNQQHEDSLGCSNLEKMTLSNYFSSDMLNKFNFTRSEMLYPALILLNLFYRDSQDTDLVELLHQFVATAKFSKLLLILITSSHRGVVREAIDLIIQLICVDVTLVAPLLPTLAQILSNERNADILRQALLCFVMIAANEKIEYLKGILQLEPFVVVSTLAALQSCKRDKDTVVLALDFLEIVLKYHPESKLLLYDSSAIEIMEDAQYLHDTAIERQISRMVESFDELVEFDEHGNTGQLDEEIEATQQLYSGKQVEATKKYHLKRGI